ncbi:hypothetical protein Bcop_1837 [Bacteroides coprosuis DSM 18011]|uniref:Uncharacterized protein n=1 Tax=Bacteroides coprosuis DSM 18011 TaxID=679937 RepID=F3ZRT6_9BACE|nr:MULTISPECIES: hypothetical protein [Bacteroides]EGJ72025.1 hypothetical protein Bcop_1837 [Bacteroides coprosuis DSM 18011]HJD91755.1 hypothetical protein [Bacteroides coprosuis]
MRTDLSEENTRWDEDTKQLLYYDEDLDEWFTRDEILEHREEIGYWDEWSEEIEEQYGDLGRN